MKRNNSFKKIWNKKKSEEDIEEKSIEQFATLETEQCVLCGTDTGVLKNLPADARKYYISGVGQLCENCYLRLNVRIQESE